MIDIDTHRESSMRVKEKEVKALIASAKTKEDHLKLADYYKAETERLEAEATNETMAAC